MTQNSALGVGALAAAAAVVLLVGYRIRRGDVWLVAGYRPDRVRDPAALARHAGAFTLTLGVVLLAAAVVALVRAV